MHTELKSMMDAQSVKGIFVCVNLPRPRLNRGQLHSNNLKSGFGHICQYIKDLRTAKYDNRKDEHQVNWKLTLGHLAPEHP